MKIRRNIGNTIALYEEDAYLHAFEAEVITCTEEGKRYAVVLTQTAFFPEGGGQYADRGTIGQGNVLDVQQVGDEIVHYVDVPLTPGKTYACALDFADRFKKMQNHSAEHLLSGLIHGALGYENVGFHLSETEVTMDVGGVLTEAQIAEFERVANQKIYENLPITAYYPTPEELAGLQYRSKLDLTENVRIVTVEGVDVCACCAPHVASTAEIGLMKIVDYMPHRGGTRLTMMAGILAYQDYAFLAQNNKQIMASVSASRYETAQKVQQLSEKSVALSEQVAALKREVTTLVTNQVVHDLKARGEEVTRPYILFPEGLDEVGVRTLVNACCAESPVLIGAFWEAAGGYRFILSRREDDPNLPVFTKEMTQALSGRGGGSPKMVQGSVTATKEQILDYFERV